MFTVNFGSRIPVYQQLYDDVVRLASLGILKSHTKLPPVRTLATELGSFISEKLGQSEAEKIEAEKELKKAVSNAYKKGVQKEEMIAIIDDTISGGEGE